MLKTLLKSSALSIILSSSIAFAGDVTVSKIETREMRSSSDYVSVAVKAQVTNNSDKADINVGLQAVDRDGFEVYDMYLSGNIPPGGMGELSDNRTIRKEDYERIHDWRADE